MQAIFYNNSTVEKYSPTFPVTERLTLDESLDTTSLAIENITRKEPFAPFTFCWIDGTMWVVASDDPVWVPTLNRWTHNVGLVEPTKWLERFMVGTKTVTQPITKDYDVANTGECVMDYEYTPWFSFYNGTLFSNLYPQGGNITVPPSNGTIIDPNNYLLVDISIEARLEGVTIGRWSASDGTLVNDIEIRNAQCGSYSIDYVTTARRDLFKYEAHSTYYFSVVPVTATEDITLLDVAEDLLAIVEPLRTGEEPRFSLSDSAKDKLRGITSPEFTFTNNTLREALDEIGKVIGCISRLHIKRDGDTFVYEIDYDPFCTFEQADLTPLGTLRAQSFHQDAEQYCTTLDSTVANLMEYNGAGTVVDPGPIAFRTVRTEDTSYQITEQGAVIFTQYPIEVLEKLEIGLNSGGTVLIGDATKYCFESAEYATLSSYSPAFPYSKAYALRYSFGQRNITSLAFEMESAVSQIFKQPSLVNVINEVFGLSFTDLGLEDGQLNYNRVLFRVTYRPSVSARVITRKSLSDTPSALAFNQGAAKLDSTAFGRNAYGNALRMGNAEEERRYVVRNNVTADDLPKCGQMVGNDTFISSVERKYFANYSEVILSLSKNFNRLSTYVGIDHSKRIYEISEKLGVDRHVSLEDVCLVRFDDGNDADSTNAFASGGIVGFILCSLLEPEYDPVKKETMAETVKRNFFVYAKGEDEKGSDLTPVLLPVASYGMGTSLVFSWRYPDNYSAGTFVNENEVDGVKSYAQSDARYTDLYGCIDKMGFKILANRYNVTDSQANPFSTRLEEGRLFPLVDNASVQTSSANYITVADCMSNPVVIKKDNREALNMTYQVSFVGQDGIFVMPGLAEAMNAAEPKRAKVWVLDHPITPLSTSIDLPGRVGGAVEFSYDTATLHSLIQFNVPTVSGVAFVIATDDGEVLLGANRNVTAGELIKIRFDIVNPRKS